MRSLLPPDLNIMALTATATKQLKQQVIATLGMVDPVVVETCPDKLNLKFSVQPYDSFETFNDIVLQLKKERTHMDRILIFCRRPIDCGVLYEQMRGMLGKDFTEPPGLSHRIPEVRLLDMYSGGTSTNVSDAIIKQFCSEDSCLRVVIATIAFGMGINCPNIRKIIHFGVPTDIETFIQQVGRAGRDGKSAECVMLVGNGVYKNFCNKEIKAYVSNSTECRHNLLFSNFNSFTHNPLFNTCRCCDICSSDCSCEKCTSKL